MLTLSNIRLEHNDAKARLVADISCPWCEQKQIWYEVDSAYADYFSTDVYDAFLVALLYPAMHYKQDIHIKGAVSKRLYKNITPYVQAIIQAFSKEQHAINITADELKTPLKKRSLVGAGFSGGIDSFCTFVDHYEKESDPEYKISTLFFQNAGSHGKYSNPQSHPRFLARYEHLKAFPSEMGIPYIMVDSNTHAFIDEWDSHQKWGPTAMLAAVLAFQASLSRYYWSSTLSYYSEKYWGRDQFNFDLFEFSEPYLLPLVSTEICQIQSDGCQHFRSGKTENIIDYEPAQRFLNVCVGDVPDEKNCSKCSKCKRTLVALESAGKLQNFKNVFDLSVWKKVSYAYKCELLRLYGKEPFATDNVNFARKCGARLPSPVVAYIRGGGGQLYRLARRACVVSLKLLLPASIFTNLKRKYGGR